MEGLIALAILMIIIIVIIINCIKIVPQAHEIGRASCRERV